MRSPIMAEAWGRKPLNIFNSTKMKSISEYSPMEVKLALREILMNKRLTLSKPLVVDLSDHPDFNDARIDLHKKCKYSLINLCGKEESRCSDGTSHGRFELNRTDEYTHYNSIFKENWEKRIIHHFVSISYVNTRDGIFYTWSGSALDLVKDVELYLHVMNNPPTMIEV